ncbi:helix-turn-helix domain-containing protein [Herpetosiphon llansteffanensis]|uniref:helix-turn-helix domain-containing protein n=1 Tax=Herpetosiphon llansteffanensis TaxID=2094568 RepID=UPI00196AD78D|nr:helix-turn-helix domain-containing protein [Herpetosiphon llansteffanensis]
MASKKPTPDQTTYDPWSGRDRLRILAAADACAPGELGALLRREGMYSSHLARWRRQRAEGELAALTPKRKAAPTPEAQRQTAELARLRRENQRLQAKLAQAEVIIDVQRKLATLLGITLPAPPPDAQD